MPPFWFRQPDDSAPLPKRGNGARHPSSSPEVHPGQCCVQALFDLQQVNPQSIPPAARPVGASDVLCQGAPEGACVWC